jgi:hypothetical protein
MGAAAFSDLSGVERDGGVILRWLPSDLDAPPQSKRNPWSRIALTFRGGSGANRRVVHPDDTYKDGCGEHSIHENYRGHETPSVVCAFVADDVRGDVVRPGPGTPLPSHATVRRSHRTVS